jgi:hypothetical protein
VNKPGTGFLSKNSTGINHFWKNAFASLLDVALTDETALQAGCQSLAFKSTYSLPTDLLGRCFKNALQEILKACSDFLVSVVVHPGSCSNEAFLKLSLCGFVGFHNRKLNEISRQIRMI